MTKVFCSRMKMLYRDESGVVLAFTITVFLLIYLFGMAVYAVGDTVQKRIELQNAADAAAYSGAVVQADTLSRIAVINKAMSWNYVMMTRAQMDYCVEKWLTRTLQKWQLQENIAWAVNMPSCHHATPWNILCGYGTGYSFSTRSADAKIRLNTTQEQTALTLMRGLAGFAVNQQISNVFSNLAFVDDWGLLSGNGRKNEPFIESHIDQNGNRVIDTDDFTYVERYLPTIMKNKAAELENSGSFSFPATSLPGRISAADKNIRAMNTAIDNLASRLETRIRNAARFTIEQNTRGHASTEVKAEISCSAGKQYLEQLKDEGRFLKLGQFTGDPKRDIGQSGNHGGISTWMPPAPGDGIVRGYRQSAGLLAEWHWFSKFCCTTPTGHYEFIVIPLSYQCVTGQEVWDGYFGAQTPSKPYVLKPNYFQPDGAVTVALSLPLENPFAFLGDVSSGLFSAFTVGGGSRKLSAVAAARAGYRQTGWGNGEYRNRGSIRDEDNLCLTDWDAMFLPLNREETIKGVDFASLLDKIGVGKEFIPKSPSGQYSRIDYAQIQKKHMFH